MRIIDTLIRDLRKEGTEAVYDPHSRSLDISTFKFIPLSVTFSLQTDEAQLRAVIASHQAREGVSRSHAYDFLFTEVSTSLLMYADVPGPYVFDDRGYIASSQ